MDHRATPASSIDISSKFSRSWTRPNINTYLKHVLSNQLRLCHNKHMGHVTGFLLYCTLPDYLLFVRLAKGASIGISCIYRRHHCYFFSTHNQFLDIIHASQGTTSFLMLVLMFRGKRSCRCSCEPSLPQHLCINVTSKEFILTTVHCALVRAVHVLYRHLTVT